MKITGNEPAMPNTYEYEYGDYGQKEQVIHEGLTIRQQFAMAAMQGIISGDVNGSIVADTAMYSPDEAAIKAVNYADALINALNK